MVLFPCAKINLGLQVLRRRADGFHDIRSVMVPIPLCDVLEAVIDPQLAPGEIVFDRTGIAVPGDPAQDLCLRAINVLGEAIALPGIRAHLHKVIPAGAGLGGGSSDAAHMLLLLNDLLCAGMRDRLPAMAAALGSDVPFFLDRRPQLAEGRGELLSPIEVDLKGRWLVLVNPGIHVPTAEVYKGMRLSDQAPDLLSALDGAIEKWNGVVRNDMEEYVFGRYPQIASIKEKLIAHGAAFASMSGSGSSVFGIFTSRPQAIGWPQEYRSWTLEL